MYRVIGKVGDMSRAGEWIADAIPPGTCLGDNAFAYALAFSMPDGVVVEHDGQILVTRRRELVPGDGLEINTHLGGEYELTRLEYWKEIEYVKQVARSKLWTSAWTAGPSMSLAGDSITGAALTAPQSTGGGITGHTTRAGWTAASRSR